MMVGRRMSAVQFPTKTTSGTVVTCAVSPNLAVVDNKFAALTALKTSVCATNDEASFSLCLHPTCGPDLPSFQDLSTPSSLHRTGGPDSALKIGPASVCSQKERRETGLARNLIQPVSPSMILSSPISPQLRWLGPTNSLNLPLPSLHIFQHPGW